MANQLLQGRLERWDDDKGFGFIRNESNQKEVFIHISAFKRNISRRPLVGDTIFYELHTDANGKSKAVNAQIEGLLTSKENPRKNQNNTRRNRDYKKSSTNLSTAIRLIFLFAIIVVFAVNKYQSTKETRHSTPTIVNDSFSSPLATQSQTQYSCQGKTYCSEMSSCEEAVFYQSHCSGTKMDGDGDGVPCEDMCGH
jgi:cold shock CspA family protein